MSWYEGKSCAFCGKDFVRRWWGNKPCLIDAKGAIVEANQIQEESVETLLQTHQPACWDCRLSLAFRGVSRSPQGSVRT